MLHTLRGTDIRQPLDHCCATHSPLHCFTCRMVHKILHAWYCSSVASTAMLSATHTATYSMFYCSMTNGMQQIDLCFWCKTISYDLVMLSWLSHARQLLSKLPLCSMAILSHTCHLTCIMQYMWKQCQYNIYYKIYSPIRLYHTGLF